MPVRIKEMMSSAVLKPTRKAGEDSEPLMTAGQMFPVSFSLMPTMKTTRLSSILKVSVLGFSDSAGSEMK